MKSFLTKIIILGLPLILLVVAVNYWGDAGRLFSNDYENKLVAILLSKHAATNIGNYNERLVQEKWIAKLPDTPDVAVLGSSRAMLISSEMLEERRLVNNSVAGATLSDIEDIWRHYLALKKFPREIILEADPWLLNNDHEEPNQNKGLFKHDVARPIISADTILSLFSLTYFQRSLPALIRKTRGNDEPVSTMQRYNTFNTRCADGSLTYGEEYRNSDDEAVRSRVESYLKRGDISNTRKLNSIAAEKLERLAHLLDQMQQHQVRVILLLAPLYPKVYQPIRDHFPTGLNTERLLMQMAAKRKLVLLGSYDPAKCGLSEDCFYDAEHCNEKGMGLLLNDTNAHFVADNAGVKRQ